MKLLAASRRIRREEKLPRVDGMVPARLFTDNIRDCKGELKFGTTAGMDPAKLFHPRANLTSDVLLKRAGGISPSRLFLTKFNT